MAGATGVISGSAVTLTYTAFVIPGAGICTGSWARSLFTQDDGAKRDLSLDGWLSVATNPAHLGAAAAGVVPGLVGGTWGTDPISLRTADQKANGAVTSIVCQREFQLPPEYVSGETVQIQARAGMVTTVADTTATLDFEVKKLDADGDPTGSDLVTTAAEDINSLTLATKTFTINPSGLVAGDRFTVQMTLAIRDNATGTAVIGTAKNTELLLDIKG